MTWRTPADLAAQGWPLVRFVRGMIRRVSVTLTTGVLWQVRGYKKGANAQGGDETFNQEPFTGIGFYSTPPSSGTPQGIVAAYGSTKTSAIIALRDEATRKIGAGDLAQGETCVYNDKARIIVKADGTVEIRLHGGVAVPLLTLAEGQAIVSAFNSHVHVATGATSPTSGPVDSTLTHAPIAIATPSGTAVLRGQ